MDLFEFEGKEILKSFGIPVPESSVLRGADEEPPRAFPLVMKAQAFAGGRGKAGGIRICMNEEEFRRNAREIFDLTIKGQKVHGLLIEELMEVERELFLAITLQGVSEPTLIVSGSGGIDIEEVASTDPGKVIMFEIDPVFGIHDYQLEYIAKALKPPDPERLNAVIRKLAKAFFKIQAVQMEINPLGLLENGDFVAMDAKVILDEHSITMRDTITRIEKERLTLPAYNMSSVESTTITYVPLEDEGIGLISDGAGTGMLALDLIADAGGTLASICELGGITNAEVMYRAMQYTLSASNKPSVVLIVLIGGFNRMDDMARGIVQYLREYGSTVHIFTRMCGNKQEDGSRIMREAGLVIHGELEQTVALAVEASKGVV